MEIIQLSAVIIAASRMLGIRLSVIDGGNRMFVDSKGATECGTFTVTRGRVVKLVPKGKVIPECAVCETMKGHSILLTTW